MTTAGAREAAARRLARLRLGKANEAVGSAFLDWSDAVRFQKKRESRLAAAISRAFRAKLREALRAWQRAMRDERERLLFGVRSLRVLICRVAGGRLGDAWAKWKRSVLDGRASESKRLGTARFVSRMMRRSRVFEMRAALRIWRGEVDGSKRVNNKAWERGVLVKAGLSKADGVVRAWKLRAMRRRLMEWKTEVNFEVDGSKRVDMKKWERSVLTKAGVSKATGVMRSWKAKLMRRRFMEWRAKVEGWREREASLKVIARKFVRAGRGLVGEAFGVWVEAVEKRTEREASLRRIWRRALWGKQRSALAIWKKRGREASQIKFQFKRIVAITVSMWKDKIVVAWQAWIEKVQRAKEVEVAWGRIGRRVEGNTLRWGFRGWERWVRRRCDVERIGRRFFVKLLSREMLQLQTGWEMWVRSVKEGKEKERGVRTLARVVKGLGLRRGE